MRSIWSKRVSGWKESSGENFRSIRSVTRRRSSARLRASARTTSRVLTPGPKTQALEDVICFVFLRWYFEDFAAQHGDLDIERIVARTARKMSPEAREQDLDWSVTAKERYAHKRPPDYREANYDDNSARLRLHLARNPDTSASS